MDVLEYYWSEESEQDESKYTAYQFDSILESVVLTYDEPTTTPKTIYLHVRMMRGMNIDYKVFATKNYLKAPTGVRVSSAKINSDTNSLGVTITPNMYSGVQKVLVQISDNSMLTTTPKEQTKYKLIFTTELNKPLYPFELKINLNGLNVLDGQYYFKVTTIDSSHNTTVVYSELVDVNFGFIDRALRFDSPMIGPDGQIIRRSPVFITGNALVLAEADAGSDLSMSTNVLSFFGKDIVVELFDIRYRSGKPVDGLEIVPGNDQGDFMVKDSGNNYND